MLCKKYLVHNEFKLPRAAGLIPCHFVAELKDAKGNLVSYKTGKISDQDIVYDEWHTYEVFVSIGDNRGCTLKCYVWNEGRATFDLKPSQVSLKNVFKNPN